MTGVPGPGPGAAEAFGKFQMCEVPASGFSPERANLGPHSHPDHSIPEAPAAKQRACLVNPARSTIRQWMIGPDLSAMFRELVIARSRT